MVAATVKADAANTIIAADVDIVIDIIVDNSSTQKKYLLWEIHSVTYSESPPSEKVMERLWVVW